MPTAKKLDLSSLSKALATLAEALQEHTKDRLNLFVRDACIQRFEYSYELTHKFLRRYLELTEPSRETVEAMSFPTLIRTADERGLLQHDWSVWQTYREARNITAHTYNKDKANQVMKIIPGFLQEATTILNTLQQKIR